MKCGWLKLDKIETDCEKVNLKNIGPTFSSLSLFSLKQVVNNKIRLRNYLCLLFKRDYIFYLIFHSVLMVELIACKKMIQGRMSKNSVTQPL